MEQNNCERFSVGGIHKSIKIKFRTCFEMIARILISKSIGFHRMGINSCEWHNIFKGL